MITRAGVSAMESDFTPGVAPPRPCALCAALARLDDRIPLRTQAMATRLEAMGARGQAEQIAELAERGKRAPHEAPALRRRADELSAAADTLDALTRAVGGAAR